MIRPEAVLLGMLAACGVVGAVWLTVRIARPSAALTSSLWRIALLALWLMPAATCLNDSLHVSPLTVPVDVPVMMRAGPTAPTMPPMAPSLSPVARLEQGAPVLPWRWAPIRARGALLWLWGAGVALGAAGLLRDVMKARRLVRAGVLAASAGLTDSLATLSRAVGLKVSPQPVQSDRTAAPAVFGLRRPTLLLPAGFVLDCGASEAVIVHELAHLRRRDLVTQLAARVTLATLWWHPLAWLVSRELGASAEEACDDWAVAV